MLFLTMHVILTDRIFPQTEFGTKLDRIVVNNFLGDKITIPVKDRVTVLIFFNVSSLSHGKTLKRFDILYNSLLKEYPWIYFLGVSKGVDQEYQSAQKFQKFKLALINDSAENFIEIFKYACGKCMRVVILDREGIIRYNAGYISLNAVKEIVRRYAEKKRSKRE